MNDLLSSRSETCLAIKRTIQIIKIYTKWRNMHTNNNIILQIKAMKFEYQSFYLIKYNTFCGNSNFVQDLFFAVWCIRLINQMSDCQAYLHVCCSSEDVMCLPRGYLTKCIPFFLNLCSHYFCDYQKKILVPNEPHIGTSLIKIRNVCMSVILDMYVPLAVQLLSSDSKKISSH